MLASNSWSMPDARLKPYILLFIGIFFMGSGIASTLSGEAVGRFGRMFYRSEKPNIFWGCVTVDYLAGAYGIGYFLYKIYLAK
jgi:hypothetical protein